MPSGRNTVTATSSGPNGRPPGAGSGGVSSDEPEGENLTFTLVLEPVFLPVGEQFLLSEAVTLALTDTFAAFGIDARIKWTNDIYVGDKTGRHPHRTQLFGPDPRADDRGHRHQRQPACVRPALPNPVSMAVASGRTFDRREVLESFHACCMGRYGQLVRGEKAALQEEYRKRMYRLGETHPYRRPDGTLVEAVLEGVRPSGELILRHADGTRHAYLFREIEFVIAGKS